MKALILEGGGGKGAYEAGAIKALNKRKIFFDGVGGTSIGAINAVCYAARSCDVMYKIWLTTNSDELFGIETEILTNFYNKTFTREDIKKGLKSVHNIIKNKGIDTANIRNVLTKNISEKKFRKSKIDFGLNTFSLSDLKPVEVFKEDIPEGKLIDYVLSSAYLPFFKFERVIDDKYYVDGGVYRNTPIDMFIDKGYDEIFVVKAWRTKLKYKHKKGLKINIITPRESLGSVVLFEPSVSEYRMNLGYYDTLKFLDNLDGNKYYFKNYSEKYYDGLFDKATLKRMIKKYNNGLNPKSNKIFILKIIERICKEQKLNRFKVYNMPYLITKLKYILSGKRKNQYYDFVKNIKVDFE